VADQELFTKSLGLRWLAEYPEDGQPIENGIELIHNEYPKEMLCGKILRVQIYREVVQDMLGVSEEGTVHNLHAESGFKWKLVIEVYAGNGETKAIHMDVENKQHGIEIVNHYYNLILFGEKDLAFIEDPYGQQAWFDKEPF